MIREGPFDDNYVIMPWQKSRRINTTRDREDIRPRPSHQAQASDIRFVKHRDGTWAIRGPRSLLRTGFTVQVHKKDGTTVAVRLGNIVDREGRWAVAQIQPIVSAPPAAPPPEPLEDHGTTHQHAERKGHAGQRQRRGFRNEPDVTGSGHQVRTPAGSGRSV